MDEICIGPNACPYCGGEYGEHWARCSRPVEKSSKATHMSTIEYKAKLSPPAYLTLETPDGSLEYRFDVFKEWRFLDEAQKQPSEQARWDEIRKHLAERFEIAIDSIAESTAREFHEVIIALGKRTIENHSKNLASIASLQQPTPESQMSIPAGQSS